MGDNAFTVLPMSQRVSLQAGETYEGKITVVNPADAKGDFNYKVSVSPFGVSDEDYEIDFVTDYNRSMISKWIKINEPTGKVAPNESKDVTFTITVPENAPAGGQYASIAVTSDDEATGGDGVAVQNVFEIASIVYATVAGETKHEGEILENNVPGFVTNVPLTLSALISNNGNVHEDATFIISVKNFFTGEVILPTEEDDGEYSEIIMPETTKHIDREVSNLPALGVVKINQTIYYQGVANTVEKDVFICPIWFLVLVIITIVAIITSVVMTVRHHRKKSLKTRNI